MGTESLFAECNACKKLFSKSENVCPQCNKKRKKISMVHIGGGILIGIFLIGWFNAPPKVRSSSNPPVSHKQTYQSSQTELKKIIGSKVNIDYTWEKGGLGSIMEINFRLNNDSDYSIKDIEIHCDHFAKSGTKIDSNSRTVYDIVKPKSTQSFEKFNMGFIHDQANTTSCIMKDFSVVIAR